jgi:hypothetical protein
MSEGEIKKQLRENNKGNIYQILDEAKKEFPDCPTPDSAIIWFNKWFGEKK